MAGPNVPAMPQIREATTEDLPAIGQALAEAFEGDPVWRFLVPRRAGWQQRAARYFAADARNRLRHGSVHVDTGLTGAALWASPGAWRPSIADLARELPPGFGLFGVRTPRALRVLTQLEKVHPSTPHHYLALLGTSPASQGRGIGSALVAQVTGQADLEAVPCYLESSKEQNIAFYARHGFEVTGQIDLRGGPPVWAMWREPPS